MIGPSLNVPLSILREKEAQPKHCGKLAHVHCDFGHRRDSFKFRFWTLHPTGKGPAVTACQKSHQNFDWRVLSLAMNLETTSLHPDRRRALAASNWRLCRPVRQTLPLIVHAGMIHAIGRIHLRHGMERDGTKCGNQV